MLSKINYAVGTREKGTQVPTAYEIPPQVIEEAIVNAVAHRDYDSTGSVQVMLFADRLEIRNPGHLPPSLSIESLSLDHSSFPFNPLIAESLYLAKYIERMGTGIQDMIQHCLDAGLPSPEFKIVDAFVITIWRNRESAFEKVGGAIGGAILTDRQDEIINLMKENPRISFKKISKILIINESAVSKHIDSLKRLNVIERIGGTRGYWKINQ